MAVPSIPAAISAADQGCYNFAGAFMHAARLTWTASPEAPASNYVVYKVSGAVGSLVWTPVYKTAVGVTEALLFLGTSAETLTDFSVAAVNSSGASDHTALGAQIGITSGTPPSASGSLGNPASVIRTPGITDCSVTWIDAAGTDGSGFAFAKREAGFRIRYGLTSSPTALFDNQITAPWHTRRVRLSGLIPGEAYTCRVHALGGLSEEFESAAGTAANFTTDAGNIAILGPGSLEGTVNRPLAATYHYNGPGTGRAWSLVGAPAGLALSQTGDVAVVDLEGAPTDPGVYSAAITVTATVSGDRIFSEWPVRILVSGGNAFLAWLYAADEDAIDLQLEIGTGAITSQELGNTPVLVRGDTRRWHLLFRDAAGLLLTIPDEVVMTVRPLNQRDFPALLSYRAAPPATSVIAGRTLIAFDAVENSALLDRIFRELDSASGASIPSTGIACEMQCAWRRGARWRTSLPLDVTLAQALAR